MRVLVDDQAFDLVEHRRVGQVRIVAEGAARHDDADRRLLRQHGADLHRARMGAQHHARAVGLLVEVEGVVLLARRMLGRHVEGGEIVEVVLDMRTLGDREAEIAPDLHDLLPHLAHRMDGALRLRAHRQGDVDLLGGEARFERRLLKRRLARGDRLGDLVLEQIERRARLLALFRRHAAQALHALGDRALLAERRRRARLRARLRRRPRRRRSEYRVRASRDSCAVPQTAKGRTSWRAHARHKRPGQGFRKVVRRPRR